MTRDPQMALIGELLDDERELSARELCEASGVGSRRLRKLIQEGIVQPRGADPSAWRFASVNVRRARCALRLRRDLGVNWAGAALALELIDELRTLRARVRQRRA